MDSSQPRETGFEKELVYAKAVVRGKLVELLLKCNHMNVFGGIADDLKAAPDALMEEYGIDDRYAKDWFRLRRNKYQYGQVQWGDISSITYTALASNYSLCKSQIGTCN